MGKKRTKPKKIEQTGVVLTSDLRTQLAAAAQAADHSVSQEIRNRLQRTFDEDKFDAPTLKLAAAIRDLSTLVSIQTRHNWHSHPAAARVLRYAITARLARLKPEGDPTFAAGELPTARLVAQGSDDPEQWGSAWKRLNFTPRR